MRTYADVAHGAKRKPRFVAKRQQNVSQIKCVRQSVCPITLQILQPAYQRFLWDFYRMDV